MEGRQRDFKWFGEGFDGFPKYLPEDCVEYSLHLINPKLHDSEVRSQLRQVQIAANTVTRSLLQDFIWQREAFKLELIQEKDSIFLCGRTNYGDSVEDEWLIVYILVELSKKFPSVWCRIVDTDGEFLLIEAANVLPKWLNPEVAEYRLWINEGNLLIIPYRNVSEKVDEKKLLPKTITLQDAFSFIQENRSMLLHSPLIEAEAFYRLQKYPKQIKNSMHHSLITIPRKLAFILHDKASYISPAVEAFYLRDPVSLRLLQVHDSNKHVFPPNDLVTVSTKFTKVGFAQVKSQQFDAPLRWKSHFSAETNVKNFARLETGMKITCGFEMLLSDPNNIDSAAVREIKLLLGDLEIGDDHLPSSSEILEWEHRNDDESWLDIDFANFESELTGKATKATLSGSQGFGDISAQENLRKIVTRFEDFLNDDNAGVEGAEYIDDMDNDDEDSDIASDDTSSESEDNDISFDEDQFANMMREMMGMSAETAVNVKPESNTGSDTDIRQSTGTHIYSQEENEAIKAQQDVLAMEKELQDAGALHTYLKPTPHKATRQTQTETTAVRSQGQIPSSSSTADESDTDDIDIDYNLAKNLLESFKSQNGAAGPGGNLMGIMGTGLPRDEDGNKQRVVDTGHVF